MKKVACLFALAASVAAFAVLVVPQQMSLVRGRIVSGNLGSLFQSDDNRLVLAPGPTVVGYETPLDLRLSALCSTESPQRLLLTIESRATSPGLIQYVEMWEWSSGMWVEVDQRALSLTDTRSTIDIPTCWRFAKPVTGEMRLRYWVGNRTPVAVPNWTVLLDEVVWDVDP